MTYFSSFLGSLKVIALYCSYTLIQAYERLRANLELNTWPQPHRLDIFVFAPASANSSESNYGEDAQTDLDLWFDYMYIYTCNQAGFVIIWSLSAFLPLFLNLFSL